MLIHPLQAEELMNIVSGKTGTNIVNVDKVLQLGSTHSIVYTRSDCHLTIYP